MSVKLSLPKKHHDEIMKWGFNNENEFNYPLTQKGYDLIIKFIDNFNNKSKSEIELIYSIKNHNVYEHIIKVKERIVEIVSCGTYQDIVYSHGHVLDGGDPNDPYIMCVRLKVIVNITKESLPQSYLSIVNINLTKHRIGRALWNKRPYPMTYLSMYPKSIRSSTIQYRMILFYS
jgi:hypothetical protein